MPNIPDGLYVWQVMADYGDNLSESSESNNRACAEQNPVIYN